MTDEKIHQTRNMNRFIVLNWVRNRHGNKTNPTIDGGDFVFYPHGENGRKYSFKAEYNKVIYISYYLIKFFCPKQENTDKWVAWSQINEFKAIVVDGTLTAHGVEPYKSDQKPLFGDKVYISLNEIHKFTQEK